MSPAGHYVVLGLAPARSDWFREVSSWATSGLLPIEFVKCLSPAELRARLDGGRTHSALLVDEHQPGLDRDLIGIARDAGCAVMVVGTDRRRWTSLHADATLAPDLDPPSLHDALIATATPVAATPVRILADPAPASLVRGRLITVLGTPGSGTSVIAMALAQGLGEHGASTPNDLRRQVLLADLALDADQALLHDAGDIIPGLQELIDAARLGDLDEATLGSLTLELANRPYDLLVGLRRHRDWVSIRRRSLARAMDALRVRYGWLVADATGDVEGLDECGSSEVEDRNLLARAAAADADAVVVTTRSDLRGLFRLRRLIADLVELGVPLTRIVPVLNIAPKPPHRRAELVRAVAELSSTVAPPQTANPPLLLPARRNLERTLRDGAAPPKPLPQLLQAAVTVALERRVESLAVQGPGNEPRRIEPGSLGHWPEEATG